MANLFSTKYPNNIRTVSALVPLTGNVFPDDVVLNCNTVTGAITINLLSIPDNYWNTTYKLYINDIGNNASVNNITINAQGTQTINGASSIKITNNGGAVLIRIIDNERYIATYNSSGGGYDTIQDEGVNLPQRKIIDFVGAGVTATDDALNQKTIVTIPGATLIQKTVAEALALITSNTLLPGAFYWITNAGIANNYTQEGVIVQATGLNTFSLQGSGLFLNADYNSTGNYSTVPTYSGNNRGIWADNLPTIVLGDIVIYDNRNFLNLTGALGTAPSSDAINWQLLPYDTTKGYIREIDFICYDIFNDKITYREDKRNNCIDFAGTILNEPIKNFQWGKNDCLGNKIIGNSNFKATNSRMPFSYNIIENSTYEAQTRYNVEQGYFKQNTLSGGHILSLNKANNDVYGKISNNKFIFGDKPGTTTIDYMVVDSVIYSNTSIGSDIYLNNLNLSTTEFTGNYILNSAINIVNQNDDFSTNNVNNGSVYIGDMNSAFSSNNVFGFVTYSTLSTTTSYKQLLQDNSTFDCELDMSDPLVYDSPTKTLIIDANHNFFGIITLLNSLGKTIEYIQVNNPNSFPILRRFYPQNGDTVLFKHTLVAGITNYNLLCDAPASINTLTGRPIGSDYIEYRTEDKPLLSKQVHLRNNLVLLA